MKNISGIGTVFFFFFWFLVLMASSVLQKYINTKIKTASGASPMILPLSLISIRPKKGILSILKQ